jgi:regulator of extracellular matrix RemA (YlzA/DUF370 family)
MRPVAIAAAFAALSLSLLPSAVSAGERCGKGSACYQLVETPPVYGTVDETVLIAPERHVRRRVPAIIDEVTERVVVQPETVVARHVPAEVGVVHERVMTHAGGKKWVMRRNAHGQLVGCWVTVKPSYATVARTVVTRKARVVHERRPAIVSHRTRRVVVEPARTVTDVIPAQYGVRQRHVVVSHGSKHWQPIGGSKCGGRGLFGGNCR